MQEELQKVIALKYDKSKDIAPKVVAKGAGFIAEQILAVAQKNAVPVYQNKTLTNVLMAVEIDREVPPELYNAVAEVLAHIYRLDQVLGKRIK